MENSRRFTAVIQREEDAFVALCPELDIGSQGATVGEARTHLVEAIELFFQTASPEEIRKRVHEEVFVTRVEVRMPSPVEAGLPSLPLSVHEPNPISTR